MHTILQNDTKTSKASPWTQGGWVVFVYGGSA